MIALSEDEIKKLKKKNRAKKLAPKKHKIENVSGRSTKNLWRLISQKNKV